MNGKYLLDTNIIIALFAKDPQIHDRIANTREKGQPIPENDIWIAAIAQQHDLTLVTKDAHFNAIDHLKIEKW